MAINCVILILVGFVLCCPLTWLCRGVAVRFGQVDEPGERKIHKRAIAVTGGVAIFWSVALPLAVGLCAIWLCSDEWWSRWFPCVVEYLAGARSVGAMGIVLLGAMLVLHVVGLIDDRRELGPMVKLFVQVAAAGVLVIGFDVRLFEWVGDWGSIVLTLVWFVVITNSFNFLDNMDGLSGGVAFICGAIFLVVAMLGGQWFIGGVLGLLIGSLLGFLVFNFPRASIFMGDGGSLVVGFVIAFCSVRVTYFDEGLAGMGGAQWWAVFTPIVVLAIPLYDFVSVTLIRMMQGKSPFVGDTQHFSHRLVRKGLSRTAAVIVIYASTLGAGLGGVLLGRLQEGWQAVVVIVQAVVIVIVLALLERANVGGNESAGFNDEANGEL